MNLGSNPMVAKRVQGCAKLRWDLGTAFLAHARSVDPGTDGGGGGARSAVDSPARLRWREHCAEKGTNQG
jgi:hypothetical protein